MQGLLRRDETWVALAAVAASIAAYLFFRDQGTILGFKDTLSHLIIGRRIVVGETTGLAQLGGIWLPLQHFLMLFLAWNDTLYSTGLAGSLLSMASYVVSAVLAYKIVRVVTASRSGGFTAAAVFGLSTGVLYLQATPMGEPLMYAGMLLATYGMVRLIRSDEPDWLILAATACMALILTRYETWPYAFALLMVVVAMSLVRRYRFVNDDQKGQAYALVFAGIVGTAAVGWVLYCRIIYGDWWIWLSGEFSSRDQVSALDLPQVGDPVVSALTYWYAAVDSLQLPVLLLGIGGLLVMAVRDRLSLEFWTFTATLTPAAVLGYGLYAGNQPMEVPEFNVGTYNLRMAVVLIVPICLFVGYLVAQLPGEGLLSGRAIVAGAMIVVAAGYPVQAYLADGDTVGMNLEARAAYDVYDEQRRIGAFVDENTDGRVLVESIFNEWIVFPVQDRVIYEGSQELWDRGLDEPAGEDVGIEVIVMRTTPDDFDAVAEALYGTDATLEYGIVMQTDNFVVMRRGADGAQTRT